MLGFLLFGAALLNEKGKEASARSQIARRDREISRMDVWDGIEKQVRDSLAFYDKYNYEWYECGAYWKGDKNKWHRYNLITINANKEYIKSGLSMEEYARKYFLRRYEEKGNHLFVGGWCDFYNRLELYDDDGNITEFSISTGYMEYRDKKFHPAFIIRSNNTVVAEIPREIA